MIKQITGTFLITILFEHLEITSIDASVATTRARENDDIERPN